MGLQTDGRGHLDRLVLPISLLSTWRPHRTRQLSGSNDSWDLSSLQILHVTWRKRTIVISRSTLPPGLLLTTFLVDIEQFSHKGILYVFQKNLHTTFVRAICLWGLPHELQLQRWWAAFRMGCILGLHRQMAHSYHLFDIRGSQMDQGASQHSTLHLGMILWMASHSHIPTMIRLDEKTEAV